MAFPEANTGVYAAARLPDRPKTPETAATGEPTSEGDITCTACKQWPTAWTLNS